MDSRILVTNFWEISEFPWTNSSSTNSQMDPTQLRFKTKKINKKLMLISYYVYLLMLLMILPTLMPC